MKCVHFAGGILTMCDAPGQKITVDGRVWNFDFDEYGGPLWLKKDGSERRCQNPKRAVWDEFEKWFKGYRQRKRAEERRRAKSRPAQEKGGV